MPDLQDDDGFIVRSLNNLFSDPFRNRQEGFFQGLMIPGMVSCSLTVLGYDNLPGYSRMVGLICLSAAIMGYFIGSMREDNANRHHVPRRNTL